MFPVIARDLNNSSRMAIFVNSVAILYRFLTASIKLTLLVSPDSTASSSATPSFTDNIFMRQRPVAGTRTTEPIRVA
jgi:hypothetical protein